MSSVQIDPKPTVRLMERALPSCLYSLSTFIVRPAAVMMLLMKKTERAEHPENIDVTPRTI